MPLVLKVLGRVNMPCIVPFREETIQSYRDNLISSAKKSFFFNFVIIILVKFMITKVSILRGIDFITLGKTAASSSCFSTLASRLSGFSLNQITLANLIFMQYFFGKVNPF